MNVSPLAGPHKTWEDDCRQNFKQKDQDFDTLGSYYSISDYKRCESKEVILRKLFFKEERKKPEGKSLNIISLITQNKVSQGIETLKKLSM